jgi:hypothetical protein
MKRRTFEAAMYDSAGNELASANRYAMNSGIRASEELVRSHARTEGARYVADKPAREGDVYTRQWTNETTGRTVTVRVQPTA